jgi:N6-adenosine-specific RNA methylase IME4
MTSPWPFHGLLPGSARVIYADPPWSFESWSARGDGRSAVRHYGVMGLPEIMALPVGRLAADDCVLFLWVSNPLLPQGLEVIRAWGFEYKTLAFCWVKTRPTGKEFLANGYWTRANPELCLLATRGKPRRVDAGVRCLVEDPCSWFPDGPEAIYANFRGHSRKPDEVRDRIVRLMGAGPPAHQLGTRLVELFTRTTTPGWDGWGNEAGRFPAAAARSAPQGMLT